MHAIEKIRGPVKLGQRMGVQPSPDSKEFGGYVLTVSSDYVTKGRKKKGGSSISISIIL